MPLHIPTYPAEKFESLPVQPNSNEALALKSVRDAPGRAYQELADATPLDETALDGALYRLRKKDLLVYTSAGTYDLPSYTVLRLADSLIPIADKHI